jgi:RNA polymerase sigma-54 factor
MSMLGLNIGAQQVQKQSLVITPQLQHAISILQMNNVELEKHLEELSESNPFLEVNGVNSETKKKVEIDYRPPASLGSGISGSFLDKLLGEKSLTLIEHVNNQLGLQTLSPRQDQIAQRLLMDLTAAGYLQADLSEIRNQLGVSETDVNEVLAIVQKFEPVGIFSRSLSECLKLQAMDRGEFSKIMEIVLDNLELLAKGEFKELCNMGNCESEAIKQTAIQIRRYNPKPGTLFIHDPIENQREPDLIVTRDGVEIEISLNRASLPSVKVNLEYAAELKKSSKSEESSMEFIKSSVATGHWLARAIAQRNQTLQSVATFILKHQFSFFDNGVEGIRPLQLRMVAEALGIHESTVSRSTASVLIQTPRGTLPLKMFFSSSLHANESEEGVSARSIRQKIMDIISSENPLKPTSDAKISEILGKEGYKVARRTVAKYRELENIKSTAQRKREHKLTQLVTS